MTEKMPYKVNSSPKENAAVATNINHLPPDVERKFHALLATQDRTRFTLTSTTRVKLQNDDDYRRVFNERFGRERVEAYVRLGEALKPTGSYNEKLSAIEQLHPHVLAGRMAFYSIDLADFYPASICVDSDHIFIAGGKTGGHTVRVYSKHGEHVLSIGNGVEGDGTNQFNRPGGVAVDATHLYVSDNGNRRVQIFTKEGKYVRTIGTGGGGMGNYDIRSPERLVVEPGPNGLLYIADWQNHRVLAYTKKGEHAQTYGNTTGVWMMGSWAEGRFMSPTGITMDAECIYVSESANHRVQKLTKAGGTHVRYFGTTRIRGLGNDHFTHPEGLACDAEYLYVADHMGKRVQVFSKTCGAYVRTIDTGTEKSQDGSRLRFNTPWDVAVEPGPRGLVYVVDASRGTQGRVPHQIQIFLKPTFLEPHSF